MDQLIKFKRIGDEVLKIYPDTNSIDPRKEWDNFGKIEMFHGRYSFPNEGGFEGDSEGFSEYLKKNMKNVISLPIYLYDHSGITISTGNQYPFNDRWDAGMVGYIYATLDMIRESFGVKRVSKKIKKRALNVLKGEIDVYDDYLRGNVYGYEHVKLTKCSLGHTHEEHLDSCWGYFGDDIDESVYDNLPEETAKAFRAVEWVDGNKFKSNSEE